MTKASLGAVSGSVVEVTQKALDQPGGRAGAVTLSKFSVKSSPHAPGVGEGVEEGVAVGVEEGVAVGVGVGATVGVAVALAVGVGVGGGDGPPVGPGPWIPTTIGAPVLKKPIVAFAACGTALESNRKLYNVPQRIAFAFGFCAKVSELQVRSMPLMVGDHSALLYPAFPCVPSAGNPGC